MTIGKIWELTLDERKVARRPRYDLVIVDAPATGHGSASCRRPARSPTSPASGRSASRPRRSTGSSATESGPGSRIVALPEEMPVNETRRWSATRHPRSGSPSTGSSATGSTPSASPRTRPSGSPRSPPGDDPGRRRRRRAASRPPSRRARDQREQLDRLRGDRRGAGDHAAVPVRARARGRGGPAPSPSWWRSDGRDRRPARGQADLRLRRLGGGSARRPPRRRSRPGWPRAGKRVAC